MATAAVKTYTPGAYDHRAVDAMADIDVVAKRFAEVNGLEMMKLKIRAVFVKHNVHHVFGIGLLHRHYDLAPNEKIVELGPVSSPWAIPDGDTMTGGSVFPHTWRVFDGELRPTEYRFVPERDVPNIERPVFPADFARELIAVLKETGLDDILGVNTIEHKDEEGESMEITWGRSSIVIPSTGTTGNTVNGPQAREAFQAAWTFTLKPSDIAYNGVKVPSDEGIQARHGICAVSRAPVPPNEGIQARHGICAVSRAPVPPDEGIQARHGICAVSRAPVPPDEGIQARHGICAVSRAPVPPDGGVKQRHGICIGKGDALEVKI